MTSGANYPPRWFMWNIARVAELQGLEIDDMLCNLGRLTCWQWGEKRRPRFISYRLVQPAQLGAEMQSPATAPQKKRHKFRMPVQLPPCRSRRLCSDRP